MHTVNMILRISSVLILIILAIQIFSKKKGTTLHKFLGWVAMVLGVVILVTITIRGIANKEPFTAMYGTHLFLGGLFLYCLYKTIQRGIQVSQNKIYFKNSHRRYAKASWVLLICTLLMGVASVISHWE